MADYKVLIPKLGESVQEGIVTKLFVKEGDVVKEDDPLFELATDKVDSEIPSPVAGRIKQILCVENETYPVGNVAMIISMGESEPEPPQEQESVKTEPESSQAYVSEKEKPSETIEKKETIVEHPDFKSEEEREGSKRFYSPVVMSIASKENISLEELDKIKGSGLGGRVQKHDVIAYLEQRKSLKKAEPFRPGPEKEEAAPAGQTEKQKVSVPVGSEDKVIEMDRVRKLIANHMVMSKNVSAHVTAVVEADVTNIVLWRNKAKELYLQNYGERLSYLPIFTEAVAKALSEYRNVNVSVDGEKIIFHNHINIGIAVAKDDGNLIVPVVKDADTKNILGLTRDINNLSNQARTNKLNPDDLQDGTFSITNFGSFQNIIGTPIINQPQVAILATGLIEKKPSVMETSTGDAIVVRHKMYLSLSYDHRVVDGMLGGRFLRRIADLLEQFDVNREI